VYERLTRIDRLTRPDHSYLEDEDECLYLGEYTARRGYAYSDTNQLILNLKKPMDRRDRSEWRYKVAAIETVAQDLRRLLGLDGIEGATFVPVPPSRAKDDPEYDDRLLQVLRQVAAGHDGDIRELVLQPETMDAFHSGGDRPSIRELIEAYRLDEAATHAPRNGAFVIFDDVLTTGAHFKAVQAVLCDRFPDVRTFGLFVARRVPEAGNVEDFF
jgi:hypothetical protein